MRLYTIFRAMERAQARADFQDKFFMEVDRQYYALRDGLIRRMERKELKIRNLENELMEQDD